MLLCKLWNISISYRFVPWPRRKTENLLAVLQTMMDHSIFNFKHQYKQHRKTWESLYLVWHCGCNSNCNIFVVSDSVLCVCSFVSNNQIQCDILKYIPIEYIKCVHVCVVCVQLFMIFQIIRGLLIPLNVNKILSFFNNFVTRTNALL